MTPRVLAPEAWQTWGWIFRSVAKRRGVAVEDILGRRRTAVIAAARHEVMSSLWGSGLPYIEIGRLLGMDHTSVMHGVRRSLRNPEVTS